jgi:hypothetical protein
MSRRTAFIPYQPKTILNKAKKADHRNKASPTACHAPSSRKNAPEQAHRQVLANQTYDMEISGKPDHLTWAYRKAAWAIEDMEQDIALVYRQMGSKGLESIKDIGPKMGQNVEKLLVTYQ